MVTNLTKTKSHVWTTDPKDPVMPQQTLNLVNTMNSIIYNLPDELVQNLLLTWVDLKGVCRLDTALCRSIERTNFLRVAHGPDFILRDICSQNVPALHRSEKTSDSFVMWAMLRDISISVIHLNAYIAAQERERIAYFERHGKCVREVRVRHVDSDLRALKDLCRLCPNVTTAAVTSIGPINSVTVALIASSWKHLTCLSVGPFNSDVDLTPIAESCLALEEFSIVSYMFGSPQEALRKFFRVCPPTLRKVQFEGPLEPSTCHIIAARCPLLQELSVSTVLWDDSALLALGGGCPQLRNLSIADNEAVTLAGVAAIARNRMLVEFSISAVDNALDEWVECVAENSPLLERVTLESGNIYLTDASLVALGEHCPRLKHLWLSVMDLSFMGVEAIGAGCPLLEEFVVEEGVGDAGEGVAALAAGCPQLREISVRDMPTEAVVALAEHCPLLETADVTGAAIGDAEITALIQGCPALCNLNISGTRVTETGLRVIAAHCKQLKDVEFDANMLTELDEDQARAIFPAGVGVAIN